MVAVLTLVSVVVVVVVAGEVLLGMTETPLVKFAESLLLNGVETKVSLIETRSRDEVRDLLCELIMSWQICFLFRVRVVVTLFKTVWAAVAAAEACRVPLSTELERLGTPVGLG